MIILTDVAAKLEEILNSAECPTDFQFVVKSQGYHLDTIADKKKGINKIPVFVEMVGGEYNPVPNLKQANFTYGVNIWFPIRFKETFYALNEYLVVREMQAGQGIADIVYIPIKKERPSLIIELKHNGNAETALTQIKEKQYFKCLETWYGDILFVGINYDEKSKTHECKIEKFVK